MRRYREIVVKMGLGCQLKRGEKPHPYDAKGAAPGFEEFKKNIRSEPSLPAAYGVKLAGRLAGTICGW